MLTLNQAKEMYKAGHKDQVARELNNIEIDIKQTNNIVNHY